MLTMRGRDSCHVGERVECFLRRRSCRWGASIRKAERLLRVRRRGPGCQQWAQSVRQNMAEFHSDKCTKPLIYNAVNKA